MTDLEARLRRAMREETSDVTADPGLAEELVGHGAAVRRRRRLAGGVAGLAVVVALVPVWRSLDTSEGSTAPVGPGPTISTSHHPSPPPPRSAGWQQLPVQVDHSPKRPARLVDVRVGRHGSYDRVVVDFHGALSGYQIEKVPQLAREGSGEVVRLPGRDKVLIRLTPAAAHDALGHSIYQGPGQEEYAMPVLRGFAFLGDFEGVSLGFGIDRLTTVRVLELTSPTRLVIDFHH